MNVSQADHLDGCEGETLLVGVEKMCVCVSVCV